MGTMSPCSSDGGGSVRVCLCEGPPGIKSLREEKKEKAGKKRRKSRKGECGLFLLGHLEGHAAGTQTARPRYRNCPSRLRNRQRSDWKSSTLLVLLTLGSCASDEIKRAQKNCSCCCSVLLCAWVAAVFPSLLTKQLSWRASGLYHVF